MASVAMEDRSPARLCQVADEQVIVARQAHGLGQFANELDSHRVSEEPISGRAHYLITETV